MTAALALERAYPEPTGPVSVRHTHISVVYLTDQYAYKLKKPVDLGFLDFTDPARRLHFCQEEVRLDVISRPEAAVFRIILTMPVPVLRRIHQD